MGQPGKDSQEKKARKQKYCQERQPGKDSPESTVRTEQPEQDPPVKDIWNRTAKKVGQGSHDRRAKWTARKGQPGTDSQDRKSRKK